jgi:flagellar hook-associated protein 1 FlgK
MPGTFFGIEIGRTGLAAAQVGQDVTGHNIANAGTEGYSVQSVDQVATDMIASDDHTTVPIGEALGTGVAISRIQRARDQFLDTQVRAATGGQNYQSALQGALNQVDAAFGEPSSTGLNSALGAFFNGFHDLSNNPENLGVRATTIQKGNALAQVFQGVQQRLTSLGATLTQHIARDVQSLNGYGAQIAGLNVTIRQESAAGHPVNGLLDQRDLLLDKISGLANIATTSNADGTVNVSIGNQGLVVGTDAYAVTQSSLTAGGNLTQGELAGLIEGQSEVGTYQGKLDTLAASLTAQVNAVHRGGAGLDGTTGLDFFTVTAGKEASTISVNSVLESHPEQLAAAARPVPPASSVPPQSDAANAALLAGLKDKTDTTPGDALYNSTLQGFYQQTVSDAGGRAASARSASASAGATLTQLGQQRSSVMGVSTDSEMVNMLKYQRAYQASARVVQTMDDMVGTLINNLFSNR